jgi:hypothetical protein
MDVVKMIFGFAAMGLAVIMFVFSFIHSGPAAMEYQPQQFDPRQFGVH